MVCVFLVGGFAESKLLQQRVRDAIATNTRRVVIPKRPGLAVLRGAVMVGLGAAGRFTSRMTRYAYGVSTCIEYDPDNADHKGRKIKSKMLDGITRRWACDAFAAIVRQGARVGLNETHRIDTLRSFDNQTEVAMVLFATPAAAEARWVTDDGMIRLGELRVPVQGPDRLHVELNFGRTELCAVIVNQKTGVQQTISLNYGFGTI